MKQVVLIQMCVRVSQRKESARQMAGTISDTGNTSGSVIHFYFGNVQFSVKRKYVG